jgi:hypothetical protein
MQIGQPHIADLIANTFELKPDKIYLLSKNRTKPGCIILLNTQTLFSFKMKIVNIILK